MFAIQTSSSMRSSAENTVHYAWQELANLQAEINYLAKAHCWTEAQEIERDNALDDLETEMQKTGEELLEFMKNNRRF